MDKLKQIIKRNKKSIIFLSVIILIALVSGSIFCIMLNENDKLLVEQYISEFMTNIKMPNYLQALKTGLISESIFIILNWLLGFSIIGIIIVLFSFFVKVFVLGFSIANIITIYHTKGILISLFYIFPHHIINVINYMFLTIYSVKVSIALLYSVIKKEKLDFKPIMNRYLWLLLTSFILGIISVLLEVYLSPNLINLISK